jgi:hypothetical protein
MKCKTAGILISAAADGEISEREALALDDHLAECADCRGERGSMDALRRRLAVWEARAPAESLADAFALRLRREQESGARGRRTLVFPRLPAFGPATAAVAAVLLLVYLGTVHVQPPGRAPKPPVIADTPAPRAPAVVPKAPVVAKNPPREREAWTAYAPRAVTKVRIANAWNRRRHWAAPVALALAPGAAEAARAVAESAKREAAQKVTEKAGRLRSLIAEANITMEGVLLNADTDSGDTTPDVEPEAEVTPG